MKLTHENAAELAIVMGICPICDHRDDVVPVFTPSAFIAACLRCYVRWLLAPRPTFDGFDFRDEHEKETARIVMDDENFTEVDPPLSIEFDSDAAPKP